jgi:hypothetical protein
MRVAWVHPTWRDLVIERLAADAPLRRRFLSRCGPHGVVLALSGSGGAAGERRLPLIWDDEDWDALGDRLYALAPELEHAELAAVLAALREAIRVLDRDLPAHAGEARALARMALERVGSTWDASHAPVALDCAGAWLSLAALLDPRPYPGFLAVTWAELLPARLPDPDDLAEVQRFTDWMTLCDAVASFSPKALGELGYGPDQEKLFLAFWDRARHRPEVAAELAGSRNAEKEDLRVQRQADKVVRRVLGDL